MSARQCCEPDSTRPFLVSTHSSTRLHVIAGATAWSLHLFEQLWRGGWAAKYHHVRQYEQSALHRGLLLLGERFGDHTATGRPFHSFVGGAETKSTAHCTVVARRVMNSNIGPEAEFIFHAVARIGKKKSIIEAELRRRGVLQQSEVLGLEPEPEPESESAIQAVVTTDTTTSRRLSRHSRIAPQNFGYTTCEYCFPLVCTSTIAALTRRW